MNTKTLKYIAFCGSVLMYTSSVSATSTYPSKAIQPHDSIREAARIHAESRLSGHSVPPTVTVGRLDSRLRLPACTKPLESFSPPAGRTLGRVTVGIRCDGTKPWSLYVPVTVSLITKVVVAARSMQRGTVISADDLMLADKDVARLRHGYIEKPELVIGKVLKRNLQRGRAFTLRQIDTPKAVKKGSRVIILAGTESMQVRMPGKALTNGAKGERIRVRNISSKKELEATVISTGIVRVSL